MSKRLFLKKWHYTYQIPSPEIELILQADRERKERLQIDYGMKPPKFEQLFEDGNLYKVYSYFYYFIFYFDYEGRSFHSYLNPFKKYLFNKELLKQDFFKGYKQGTKYFEDNYLTNREGVYSNTEPIITQLKYLLNEWKGVNNSTTINELKYPDYPTHYSLGNFVRIAHNRMITSRTILTYGFYSGFYARLVEMVESYSGLLGTIESLEYTTTAPETTTADWKPKQLELAHAIVMKYGSKMKADRGFKAELARYYFEFVRTSPDSDYRGFYNLLTPSKHQKTGSCKPFGKEICQTANREKAAKWLLQHLYNE